MQQQLGLTELETLPIISNVLLIFKKNYINAYISCLYTVSPLFLGYSSQLIQSVYRPDGGPASKNDHNTFLNVSKEHVN